MQGTTMSRISKALFSAAPALLCVLWCAATQAATPATAILLNGTVVTPDAVIQNGWVAIDNGKIVSVTPAKPEIAAARILETKDIIFPGFVDLHNHPLYNIYPRWTPPHAFHNRYEWRSDEAYLKAIANPHRPIAPAHFCDIDRFVELKGLFGGTTTTSGISQPRDTDISCIAGLARNLDWFTGFYGTAIGHEHVQTVLGVQPDDMKYAPPGLADDLKNGNVDLLVVHIAEGQRSDDKSQKEFAALEKLGWLSPHTAIIHGVALTRPEFARVHAAGAALIWSPRSNMELYKETANIADAVAEKVTIAIAPDWSPTGSTNVLAELKFAKQVSDSQFKGVFSSRQLVEMATSVPAKIARIDDKVGAVKPGLYADLFLLRGNAAAPYDALVKASPDDVTLTLVGGVPVSGQAAYLKTLGVTQTEEITLCKAKISINSAAAGGNLAETEARLGKALTENGVSLGPLAECG